MLTSRVLQISNYYTAKFNYSSRKNQSRNTIFYSANSFCKLNRKTYVTINSSQHFLEKKYRNSENDDIKYNKKVSKLIEDYQNKFRGAFTDKTSYNLPKEKEVQELLSKLIDEEEENLIKSEKEEKANEYDDKKKEFVKKTENIVKLSLVGSTSLAFFLSGYVFQDMHFDMFTGVAAILATLFSFRYGNALAPRFRLSNIEPIEHALDRKIDYNPHMDEKLYKKGIIFQFFGNFIYFNIASDCFSLYPYAFPLFIAAASMKILPEIPRIAGVMYNRGDHNPWIVASSIYHYRFMDNVYTYSMILGVILIAYILFFDDEEEFFRTLRPDYNSKNKTNPPIDAQPIDDLEEADNKSRN